jgi:DNA primase
MDFNATIDLIIKDLDDAREIIDDLKNYPGVPVLQIELAKSKCKSAGEIIALLKGLKENIQEQKTEKASEPVPVEIKASPTENKEEPPKISKKEPESAIFADKFSHLSNRFNEQIGSLKADEDISDILKTKPLADLSDAIGINDRFLFIREIFDGNKDAYNQAINRLNSSENIKDARAVIMSYTGGNLENEAIKQLFDLVKRKFPHDE